MSEWKSGDKVRLTGESWKYVDSLQRGDVVVIEEVVSTYEDVPSWSIQGSGMVVDQSSTSAWGGEKVGVGEAPQSGEVRSVSSTGGEKGVKPEEYALIPWEAMDEIARVYAFGANKYAAHNWRKGYEWSKSFSALCRHIFAFWKGEERDPESGLSHLAHAGFHVLGMLTFWLDKDRYGEFDDRYKG